MSVNELAARRQRNALNRFLAVEDDYWIHDTLPTERLAEVATAGLIGGLDSPSLRILAGQAASSPSADNRELWIRSIEELARVPPEPPGFERAAVRLARAIVAGRIAPERGINVGWNLAAEARGPAGELHDSL